MRTWHSWLAATTSRYPWRIVTIMLLLSVAFGAATPFAVNDDSFAVDNAPARALALLDETFTDQQSVVQVVVTVGDGSVLSQVGVVASAAIQEAIRTSPVAQTLVSGGQQPPIASYAGDVELAAQMAQVDLRDLDAQALVAFREQARAMLPEEVAELFDALVAESAAESGLILVFQRTAGLDDAAILDQQRALAAVVESAPVPPGVAVEAFSFPLLLNSSDIGPEIGRLFGTALLIILLVLGVVYWLRPSGQPVLRIARRTAADVAITLLIIVLSVVWMQGVGVALGPSGLGWISGFSPQTQIVPILIVGLGVDFAIHLLARYRVAAAGSGKPDVGFAQALKTVGPTLALCTAATAIGFLTNLASPVDFLATLGVLAAAGIAAAFILTVTLVPALRSILDLRAVRMDSFPTAALDSSTERVLPTVIARTAWLAERIPGVTVAVALLIVGVGVFGFTQLSTAFELTDFVPQDEPRLATFETITREFGGGFDETTQVLLTGEVAAAADAGAIDSAIATLAQVDGVDTFGGQPDATFDVNAAGDVGRIELRTRAQQSGALALAADIAARLTELESVGVDVVVTSQQIVQGQVGEDIEDAQIRSLLIALAAAMALLALYFAVKQRRPIIGVVTVAPVLLVLAATFGTMAATGIPLNAVTATLAALSIGIGVPFTIHVTSRYLEERQIHADTSAIRRTLGSTGGALAGSALTTAIGFGVLMTSTLKPFEQLGYVIVYAIAYSLVAAVLVLPSLLVLSDRVGARATRAVERP